MYVISASNKIVYIDIAKFLNDVELHSYIWKIKYNVEFAKQEQKILEYVQGK